MIQAEARHWVYGRPEHTRRLGGLSILGDEDQALKILIQLFDPFQHQGLSPATLLEVAHNRGIQVFRCWE